MTEYIKPQIFIDPKFIRVARKLKNLPEIPNLLLSTNLFLNGDESLIEISHSSTTPPPLTFEKGWLSMPINTQYPPSSLYFKITDISIKPKRSLRNINPEKSQHSLTEAIIILPHHGVIIHTAHTIVEGKVLAETSVIPYK